MPICELCHAPMEQSDGCTINHLIISGKRYNRIKVGDFGDLMPGSVRTRCRDCNSKVGYYHHWGCDAERCPRCGKQLISCDCEDIGIEEE